MGLFDRLRSPTRIKAAEHADVPLLGYFLPPTPGARPVAIKANSSLPLGGYAYNEGRIAADDQGYSYAYTVSVWAYRCVNIRRKAVGRMPWKVVNKATKEVWADHPLAVALRRNKQKFFGKVEFTQCLYGETFVEKVARERGPVVALNWLNNLGIDVDTTTGSIQAYHYAPVQGGRYETFKPDEVAFMRTENPYDDLRGLSPFLVILDEIGIDRDVARTARAFYANDMRLGVLFVPESPMQDSDRKRFMDFFKANHQGAKNAGKPALLSHPMKEIRDAQQRPSLDDVELRESVRREICTAFGVPLAIAGAWDDANYDSVDTQRRSFYEETIVPQCDDIADWINTDVLPDFDPRGEAAFQFDYTAIMPLLENQQEKVTLTNSKLTSGGITLNRWREMNGEKPLANGNVLYIPAGITVTPVDKLGQMPAPQPPAPSGGLFQSSTPLVQAPVRSIPVTKIDAPVKTIDAPAVASIEPPAPVKLIPAGQDTADDELAAWEKKALNGGAPKALAFTCYKLPTDIQERIRFDLASLDREAPRGAVKAVFAAARLAMKEPVEPVVKQEPIPPAPDEYAAYWDQYDRLQAELGDAWLADYMAQAWRALSTRIDGFTQDSDVSEALRDYAPDLSAAWIGDENAPGPLTRLVLAGMAAANESARRNVTTNPVKALPVEIDWNLLSRQALDFTRQYTLGLIRNLNETTREQVRAAIEAWIQSGEPLDSLKKSLEAIFKDPTRAQVIAQTEGARAYNEGAQARWSALDIQQMTFQTNRDEAVCPTCAPLQGAVGDVGVGWTHPQTGALVTIPVHPNCRCFSRPVVG